ncbi:MAG: arginine--tRNA ligase [Candidatus Vogelbacteria bacterium]|nr:arginine--tRNA ligase [Candidatus Vogelbacteria bacterium]
MKEWSLEDFNKFYDLVNIHHDYTLGESFYAARGDILVQDKLSSGEIVLFTDELAKNELNFLQAELEASRITQEIFTRLQAEVENDIGVSVVLLKNHKRFLVKKSNGTTLYATRDLAGIEHKVETFHPARLVYEVGGEQTEYFRNLFEAARVLNLVENESVDLTHVAHGLYVDSKTGKKLSSREGAESVERLIKESIKYFRAKYDQRSNEEFPLSADEKDANAKKLAVGSIAFNDIKQDKKFPIAFDQDIEKNIKSFEESGGAYIMYSLARARSIIRKSDVKPADAMVGTEDYKDLSEDEVGITKMIAEYPRVILKSASLDSPSILAGYLLDLANAYNSYYEKYKVLEKGKLLYPHRLLVTNAVATVLDNGLKLCHAEAPEII